MGAILILPEDPCTANFAILPPLTTGKFAPAPNPLTSCRACLPALLVEVDRMAIVVSRLLGTVCRSGGGHLVRARRSRHVWLLRIPGDVSAGRWRGYFANFLVILEGTPNSAAAERVFSLLNSMTMFGDSQMSALADMIQAALMLKYNQCKVG